MTEERYGDHAANERTSLAWVRTAIAVMAFGFLVEKFDLFLEIASQTLARRTLSAGGQLVGNIAGLILIGLGAGTIVLALIRFRGTAIEIDSAPTPAPGTFGRGPRRPPRHARDGLFVYLSYTVINSL